MNITGIITEYNPFHLGHLHHLTSAKKSTNCDGVVCIMSGNFMQRGGPAIVDKWKRTEMALLNGVDLVLELPTFYAVSSAESFAHGAVSILNSLGVIDNLFFGSECGDIKTLTKIAQTLAFENDIYKQILKKHLNTGLPYVKARELALIEYSNDENINDVISSSNNILGIEYIKSILRLNSSIKPMTLKREGALYNDKELNNHFSSATSIRQCLKNNELSTIYNDVPESSFYVLSKLKEQNYPFSFDEDIFSYIKYLITTECINFNNLPEANEGLDKKLLKEIYSSKSLEELILKVKSKRYTYTKISRILTQIYIGFYKYDFTKYQLNNHHYARVLGFTENGKKILTKIKANSTIPLITKLPKEINNPLLKLDLCATKAYSVLNSQVNPNSDYLISPIIK